MPPAPRFARHHLNSCIEHARYISPYSMPARTRLPVGCVALPHGVSHGHVRARHLHTITHATVLNASGGCYHVTPHSTDSDHGNKVLSE